MLEVWSLNHWTTREVLRSYFLKNQIERVQLKNTVSEMENSLKAQKKIGQT